MVSGILKLSAGETYGYEITMRPNAMGFTDVVEGTVCTILIRLEKYKLMDIKNLPVHCRAGSAVCSNIMCQMMPIGREKFLFVLS